MHGKAFFQFETKQEMFLEETYIKKRTEKKGKITETWFTISADGTHIPIPLLESGTPIKVNGHFDDTTTSKFGWNLIVSSVEEAAVEDQVAIEYLSSKAFKGISRSEAAQIVNVCGADVAGFVKSHTNCESYIMEKVGMRQDVVRNMLTVLQRTGVERELFMDFAPQDIPYVYAQKAVSLYGIDARKTLMKDPYTNGARLGLTFVQCDRIAKNYDGFHRMSPERMWGLNNSIFSQMRSAGDIWMKAAHFYRFGISLEKKSGAFANGNLIKSAFTVNNKMSTVMKMENETIYVDINLYNAEKRIKDNLVRLAKTGEREFSADECCKLAEEAEKACHVTLGMQQKLAFSLLQSRGVKILTGGPGTGKTTTLKAILFAFTKCHPKSKIKLCAPTGRAAQRMQESTEMEATTVHKLLDYVPYGDTVNCKSEKDPIDADFIVMDEASMIDVDMFDKLLCAIKDGSTLLLLGDTNQLESVGAGSVLLDLLKAPESLIARCCLSEVFRQKGGSPIIENAKNINLGSTTLVEREEDFRIFRTNSEEDTLAKVKDLVSLYHDPKSPFRTQILCPSKKGVSGVNNCNSEIQKMVNTNKSSIRFGSTVYKVNDKILMTKNNYQNDPPYYNGDIGIIRAINDRSMDVEIRGEIFHFEKSVLSEMKLAYSMTIHKSQGSEFENVIVVLPKDTPSMLTRNLFYTAVTRAKKRVFVISEGDAMEIAIRTKKKGTRNTFLGGFLERNKETAA